MEEEKSSVEAALTRRATRSQSRPWPRTRHFRPRSHVVSFVAVCLSLCILLSFQGQSSIANLWISTPKSEQYLTHNFQWSDIEPSQSLQYLPCYKEFQCARLSVPLNWNSTSSQREKGPRLTIALIKLPAKVPVTHPQYGGPVIVNPGGPGESGISQVLADGKNLQIIIDSPLPPANQSSVPASGKYFDVLSFDPRGVNNTKPGLQYFADTVGQEAWRLTYPDFGLLWDSETIVGMEMARAAALGASCSQEAEGKEVLRYVNTAQVVEDMLEIIEREGEWRANEAQRLTALEKSVGSPFTNKARAPPDEIYHPGHEKLQYWGMSYGTLIGSTFAAMHPDRVARIVLDGVVDPADHYSGDWLTQLQDSDKVITELSKYCYQAGPEKCPLYVDSSPGDIEDRFSAILDSLKANPLPVISPASSGVQRGPVIITYGDVHLYLLSGIYFPYATAKRLFKLVHALESRNISSPILEEIVSSKHERMFGKECQHNDPRSTGSPKSDGIPYISMMGPFQAISCMDSGGGPTNLSREDFLNYLVKVQSQSRWVSPNWARNKLSCLGYTATPAYRPDLSFQTQQWDNTSHPLLIIGNSHDPVTPLANARRVGTLFPGSVVLQQKSEGHCSHSSPSICIGKAVRKYFQTGQLPRKGTACETEYRPFVGCVREGGCRLAEDSDMRLSGAMAALADPFRLDKKRQQAGESQSWIGGRGTIVEDVFKKIIRRWSYNSYDRSSL